MHADTNPSNDADNQAGSPETDSTQENPATEAAPQASTEETSEHAEESTEDAQQALEADVAKWKELSLRTAAEMENLRKRTTREREDAIRYANQRLLEELLPVIDSFEMGMQAASQDSTSMIYIGMDMVRKQLNEFLSTQGVQEIPTDGKFDPNIHEAVSQEACGEGEEGRILRVTRRGYTLRDRLLRPASVVVSKLPASSESSEEGQES